LLPQPQGVMMTQVIDQVIDQVIAEPQKDTAEPAQ